MTKKQTTLSFTKVATVNPATSRPLGSLRDDAPPRHRQPSAAIGGARKENEAPPANPGELRRQLVAMGFAQVDCLAALAQSSHDLPTAVNKLLGGFTACGDQAAAPPAPPRAAAAPKRTAAAPKRTAAPAAPAPRSPMGNTRPADEDSLVFSGNKRLARRRVETALSRAAGGDWQPDAAAGGGAKWPLRVPQRVVAPAEAKGAQEWEPLDAPVLQGARNVLVRKEPQSAAAAAAAPAASVASADDMVTCPLCGARVQRTELGRHIAAESVDAPLEDEDEAGGGGFATGDPAAGLLDSNGGGASAAAAAAGGAAGARGGGAPPDGVEVLVLDSDDEADARPVAAAAAAVAQQQDDFRIIGDQRPHTVAPPIAAVDGNADSSSAADDDGAYN